MVLVVVPPPVRPAPPSESAPPSAGRTWISLFPSYQPYSFHWYRQNRTAKAATFYNFLCQGERFGDERTLCGNHDAVESLERGRPGCPGAAGRAGLSRIAPDGPSLHEK